MIKKLEDLYRSITPSKNNESNISNNNNNNNNISNDDDNENYPMHKQRIEVFFSDGNIGWYRGTFFSKRGKHVIEFDDGEVQHITNWEIVKWRRAKAVRFNKNKIKA